jgi:hypothetical protein
MNVKNSLQITKASGAYDDDGHAKRTGKKNFYSIINNQLIFSVIFEY